MKLGKFTVFGPAAGLVMIAGLLVAPLLGKGEEQINQELRQELAQARKQRLADLESYIKQHQFPHNHDFEGERVPYLVDRHGRLCAVAYLFAESQVEDFDYGLFIQTNQVAVRSPNAPYSMRFEGARNAAVRKDALEKQYAEAFNRQKGPALEVQARFEKQLRESDAQREVQLREHLTKARDRAGSDDRNSAGKSSLGRSIEGHRAGYGDRNSAGNAVLVRLIERQLRELEERRADGSVEREVIEAIAAIRNCGRHRALFQALPSLAGDDNNVRVKDLKPGPLATWILSSGLTREECAMIQPSYSFLFVSCDHCKAGSEDRVAEIEGGEYYRKIRVESDRVSAHLKSILVRLRVSSDESLDTATLRLQQARR